MSFSPFDSAIFRKLYGDPETAGLFTDSAEVRALLLVEGILAKVQGDLGIIPRDSAYFIQRASIEVQIDPAALADGTAGDGTPVTALVAAFRKAMESPEHAGYVHYGATVQGIHDTAVILRLRRFLAHLDARLDRLATLREDTFKAEFDTLRTRLRRTGQQMPLVVPSGTSRGRAGLGPAEVEAAVASALGLGIGTPETARGNRAGFATDLADLVKTLDAHRREPPDRIAEGTVKTMATLVSGLAEQLHRIAPDNAPGDASYRALESLLLPQICIATIVALNHSIALAGR